MSTRRITIALAAAMVVTTIMPAAVMGAPSLSTRTVQGGLVVPWDVAFAPDGQMFVTERPGRVRVYANGRPGAALLATTTITDVRASGEAGVMGMAVDHLFAQNRLVYVCVSRTYRDQWLNQVIRFKVGPDWKLSFDRYLVRTGMVASTIHNGCAVEEGPDKKIWVSMGDANQPWRAQHPSRLNGKILRINRDGSIPSDNPIMAGTSQRTFVYSMGHRNPQGIAFQPGTGRAYAVEHGPEKDDEINWIRAGRNFGWPCVTGTNNPYLPGTSGCSGKTFTRPAWSSEGPTLATSNGVFLRKEVKWDTWTGQLVVSTLKQQDLRRFELNSKGTSAKFVATMFDGRWGRLRATVIGPGQQLYVTTSNGTNDRVIRITPR